MRENTKSGAMTEVTFLVLLATVTPRHGYAIMQFAAAQTNGRVNLGAGTLYGALDALEKRQWIAATDSAGDTRKKAYAITTAGKEAAAAELRRLQAISILAESILGGCVNDETRV